AETPVLIARELPGLRQREGAAHRFLISGLGERFEVAEEARAEPHRRRHVEGLGLIVAIEGTGARREVRPARDRARLVRPAEPAGSPASRGEVRTGADVRVDPMPRADRSQDGRADPRLKAALLAIAGADGGPQRPVLFEGPVHAHAVVETSSR